MFWTDWGLNPRIEKATLNGNQRISIVTSDLYRPNGIELDRGNQKIFWADTGVDRVESVDYDGSNRRLLFQLIGLHPCGVALIPPFLYFTDWATRRGLHKLDADTGDFIISDYTVSGRAMGIVAYDSSRQSSGIKCYFIFFTLISCIQAPRKDVTRHFITFPQHRTYSAHVQSKRFLPTYV